MEQIKDIIIGQIYYQYNCDDNLLVLNGIKFDNGKTKFECEFQKIPCKVFASKECILRGTVFNPKIKFSDSEFIGKEILQNCGDILKVLRKTDQKTLKEGFLFEAEFVKYKYKVLRTKISILNGYCINPLIEENEFIGKEFKQNCGDILIVLEKTDKKSYTTPLYRCKFKKYEYEVLATKSDIKKGTVLNPQVELNEFIGKEFLQHCGDILKVIKRSKEVILDGTYAFECEFQKYPCKVFTRKSHIIRGIVDNPEIERVEFIEKLHLQKCGDSLKVLEKMTEGPYKGLWKAEFQNIKCIVYASKYQISKTKNVSNPQIELNEMVGKEFPQHCGDTLKILEKTNQRIKNNNCIQILWRATFIKHPYEILAIKGHIIKGFIDNPLLEEDFMDGIYPQKCGDSVKILQKVVEIDKNGWKQTYYIIQFLKHFYIDKRNKREILAGTCTNPQIEIDTFINILWKQKCGEIVKVLKKVYIIEKSGQKRMAFEIEYQNRKYKEIRTKGEIILGTCINPLIEIEEFINKEWPQNCGDTLKIIEKTNIQTSKQEYLYRAVFKDVPYEVLRGKMDIIEGGVFNPLNPNCHFNKEENSLREYIESIYKGKILKNYSSKETEYKEADIYLPEKKIAIEYNGFLWHEEGNPNNKFGKPIGYHENKRKLFESLGIKMYFIWDYEWFEDKAHKIISEKCKERVKSIIFGEDNIS